MPRTSTPASCCLLGTSSHSLVLIDSFPFPNTFSEILFPAGLFLASKTPLQPPPKQTPLHTWLTYSLWCGKLQFKVHDAPWCIVGGKGIVFLFR